MPDVQPNPNPRAAAMEAIANRSREVLNAEIKEAGGTTFVPLDETVPKGLNEDDDPDDAAAEAERARLEAIANGTAADTDDEQRRLQAAQAEADETARLAAEEDARVQAAAATGKASATSLDPQSKVTIKVDGRDIEMTWEEAQRRLQKSEAADQRLEQAAHERREAERIRREAEELQRSLQATPPAKKGDEVAIDPATTKEFTSALFKGDEEAAAQAFNKAVSSAVTKATADAKGRDNATPIDPVEIAGQVRQQIAIDSALERSRKDYPQMYADPDIEALGATKVARVMKEKGLPFTDALGAVETELSSKFGWKRAAGTPTPQPRTDRREDKLARKESLEPTPSGPNVKTKTDEETVASVHDTIQEMARQRGQSLGV